MRNFVCLLMFILGVVCTPEVSAEQLRLADVVGDHAVLQRGGEVCVWGTASPGAKVTVSFADQEKTATADDEGKWSVELDAMDANDKGASLEVTDDAGGKITLNDVLVGDVWLCSGQSNMQGKVRHGLARQDPNDPLMESNLPAIRHFTTGEDQWLTATPGQVKEFTRVGFCFAREVYRKEKVPLGLVLAAVGGSGINSWLPPSDELGLKEGGGLFTKHIVPVTRYRIKGMIWYQGEANANEGIEYLVKVKHLITSWRQLWGDDDLPFYVVQLAGIGTVGDDVKPEMGTGRARIREAQRRVLDMDRTGMAVAIDIGADGEHPGNKVEVGQRLAYWALHHVYGRDDVVPSGPLYKSSEAEGDTIRVKFDFGDGLMKATKVDYKAPVPAPAEALPWLSICDEAGTWHWAEAKIEGSDLLVSSAAVKKPTAVRYAYQNRAPGVYLYNAAGLPASPFTTEANPWRDEDE